MQHGRLPKELPFTMSLGYDNFEPPAHAEEVERKPMSKDLLDAVSTDETFDALYMVRTYAWFVYSDCQLTAMDKTNGILNCCI